MVDYRRGTQEEWDALAPVQQPDAWDTIMDDVEEGLVVVLPYGNEEELRSKRLMIGRRANKRGFKVEFRIGADQIAVRRLSEAAIRALEVEEPLRSHLGPQRRQEQAHDVALEEAVEGEANIGHMGGR